MYGPTGCGKTYTMLGTDQKRESLRQLNSTSIETFNPLHLTKQDENSGVLLYAMDHAFKELDQFNTSSDERSKTTTIVKCSYVEIYNDSIYDLLQDKEKLDNPLSVNEIDSKKFVVKGVLENTVRDVNELLKLIKKGESIV